MVKDEKGKQEEIKELFKEEVKITPKKRIGKVISFNKQRITVNINGNGERIVFDPNKHKNLKIGDSIEL